MKIFRNKIIVITGAGSGIGRELALQFAQKGAKVIASDINESGLEEINKLAQQQGNPVHTFVCDVSDEAAVMNFRNIVNEKFGPADVLINNAGTLLQANDFRAISQEDWEWIFRVNFWSVVYHCRAFLPDLLSRPEANISNISSVYGLMGMPEYAPYCSSKFAVRGFSESLHVELLDSPVCVTTVHPAGVRTNIIHNSRTYDEKATAKEAAIFATKLAKTTAKEAAETIIRGIQKNKSRLLIGKDARILDRFVRYMPEWRIPLFRKFTSLYKRRKKIR